jgi:hypothetical protein
MDVASVRQTTVWHGTKQKKPSLVNHKPCVSRPMMHFASKSTT